MAQSKLNRRLAAILAADVVGYSRLIRADEEATLDHLQTLRVKIIDPKFAEHNGRIVKLMGDGILVEFASVVGAVRAAVEVQRSITEYNARWLQEKRIVFRIGINLGDVVIDGDDIQGDGVNVAARLEGLADPGGICVSGGVYDQVRDRVDTPFDDMGKQVVKNIDRPLQVWRWADDSLSAVPKSEKVSEPLSFPDKPSIAVLSFDNMSGDPDQEYFTDGISEDIITDLSKISALFVIARNSSFSYKGEATSIQQVSRDLGVRYVVEGSVRKAGNRVRITAQLIDAHTGGHVWADRYDRELDDIFTIQDEITSEIVGALQLVLLPGEAELVARAPTSSFQAYDFYLKGRQSFNSVTKANLIEARQWFERAIECDPNFARAYCGLADCGSQLYADHTGDKKDMDGVIDAVTRALELEPNLAEAHASMGLALSGSMGLALSQTGERRKAEEEFAIAIELDPDLYEAHYYWARFCFERGNLADAAEHFEQAWRVSPRDPQTPSLLLGIYRDLNREEDVKTVARKTLETGLRKLEVEPENTRACMSCAFAFIHLGRYSEAVNMMDHAIKIDPFDRLVHYNLACAYSIMGKVDKALDYLEKMTSTGTKNMDWAKNDGDLDSIRDHPRFKKFMKKLGA